MDAESPTTPCGQAAAKTAEGATASLARLSTGLPRLDEALGGGLLPGSLVLVVGATGIGKTQLAMHFSHSGLTGEGRRAAIIDLSSRGDSQFHAGYVQRMFGSALSLRDVANSQLGDPSQCFSGPPPADVLAFLGYGGRRVLRSQLDTDAWDAWQSELNRRTPELFRFVYQHLMLGTRRFVIDGIEPTSDASDSLQMDLVELIYHRMLRQEHDWLAREVLRQRYREHESQVAAGAYDHRSSAAVVLVTTRHTMLESLLQEPLADGDVAAGANTLILMGKLQSGGQSGPAAITRGLAIVKHRGSYADSNILPFTIDDNGLNL
jgi:hypothetical protein